MNTLFSMRASLGRWLAVACLAATTTLATIQPAAAQATGPSTIRLQPDDLERGQYGHQSNFFFLPPGQTGENYVSAGFFGQKLRPYLGTNQQALAELDKYKRQKSLFLADKVLLYSGVLLYASQVYRNDEFRYREPAQLAAASMIATSLIATIFINRRTNEYLKQAVDNYNTDLPATRRGSLRQLRPATYGLAATPQGQPVVCLSWKL